MDKQDLRYLLNCKSLPIYDISILIPIWDSILKEYETLTNNFGYTMSLRKISSESQKINRLNGLIACFYLVKYNLPGSKEALKYWNINNDSITNLKTIILREKTKLSIDALRNNKTIKSDFDFDRMLVTIQNARERDFYDIDKISVKQWVFECKEIENKIKQLESLKNGRGQNTSR